MIDRASRRRLLRGMVGFFGCGALLWTGCSPQPAPTIGGAGGQVSGGGGARSGGAPGTGGGAAAPGGTTGTGGGTAGATGVVPGTGGAPATSTGGGPSVSTGGRGGASGGNMGSTGGASAIPDGGVGGGTGVVDPGTDGDGDFVIGPTYTDSPDLAVRNVPHGRANFMFTMNSTMSAIFPGTDSTLLPANQHSFTRAIRVYIPQQYVDGTEAPFMIVQDGYVDEVVKALDNLIADPQVDRRVPPVIAIFVANGGGDSKGSERGLEYDTMSDRYARFIDTEVLPAVQANTAIKAAYPNLKFTSNPEGRAAYGCSSGGAAAFTMGWFTPNYRRLITYSGTFVDQQDDDAPTEALYPAGAWEYHQRLIAAVDAKPLRVFLQVGENDNGATAPESGHHNWVLANQRMAAALKAKGYHYRYVFAMGASHCDARVRRQTLPDTLRWMWRGYPLN